MTNTTKQVRFLCRAALIGALYCVLTYVSALLGLSSGAVQIRLSEILTILPAFTPAAIPGLFIGCALSNILTGCALWDVVFGSVATLLGAIGTHYISRINVHLAPIPPILANATIVPFVLKYTYGIPGNLWYFALTVGLGEVIACGLLGEYLIRALKKHGGRIFRD